MQRLLILSILFVVLDSCQTAHDYLRSGDYKYKMQDYEGAVKDYNKAIKLDSKLTSAYFARGTIALDSNYFESAISDFSKAIELDSTFLSAYFNRAIAYSDQKKYTESLNDLDKIIEDNEKFKNALVFRGQLHFALNNTKSSCKDFERAKENGDPAADWFLLKYCDQPPNGGERLVLHWPLEENWKIVSNKGDLHESTVRLLGNNETLENWTELATLLTFYDAKYPHLLEETMNTAFKVVKSSCPKALLTMIEKEENSKYPWIIFTTECVENNNDSTAYSQLWFIIQGKTNQYISYREIKEAAIPIDTKNTWIEFFKNSEIVNGNYKE